MATLTTDYWFDDAIGDLRAVAALQPIGHDAIKTYRRQLLERGEVSAGTMENLFSQSSFLIAHATFEGFIKQLSKLASSQLGPGFQEPRGGSFLERSAVIIQEAKGNIGCFSGDRWLNIVLLSRVRNVFTHSLGFRDRPFEDQDFDRMFKFGIRYAIAADKPECGASFLEVNSISHCVDKYCGFLEELRRDALYA